MCVRNAGEVLATGILGPEKVARVKAVLVRLSPTWSLCIRRLHNMCQLYSPYVRGYVISSCQRCFNDKTSCFPCVLQFVLSADRVRTSVGRASAT